jgi:hypothetical protein
MATIITVHGTFATGTEEGSDWWQRGSAFDQDIGTYVEAQDGHLSLQPYIWDGANSELSRRAASRGLRARIMALNKRNESHCLIGHSHGGSVVARAVFDPPTSTTKALSRWITIGTPFIVMTKRKLLLSRLGLFGKTLYLTFFSVMYMGSSVAYLCRRDAGIREEGGEKRGYQYRLGRWASYKASLSSNCCLFAVLARSLGVLGCRASKNAYLQQEALEGVCSLGRPPLEWILACRRRGATRSKGRSPDFVSNLFGSVLGRTTFLGNSLCLPTLACARPLLATPRSGRG